MCMWVCIIYRCVSIYYISILITFPALWLFSSSGCLTLGLLPITWGFSRCSPLSLSLVILFLLPYCQSWNSALDLLLYLLCSNFILSLCLLLSHSANPLPFVTSSAKINRLEFAFFSVSALQISYIIQAALLPTPLSTETVASSCSTLVSAALCSKSKSLLIVCLFDLSPSLSLCPLLVYCSNINRERHVQLCTSLSSCAWKKL